MSNTVGDWMDSICNTFGWGGDDEAEELQTAQKGVTEKVYDVTLPRRECADGALPSGETAGSERAELDAQLLSLRQRLNAARRRVAQLADEEVGELGTEPGDPRVNRMDRGRKAIEVSLIRAEKNWDKMSSHGRALEIGVLLNQMAALECRINEY